MEINKIDSQNKDENCSVPVPENSVEVPRLTQFSPGAG